MATTLHIIVHYDSTDSVFSYDVTYFDGTTRWSATLEDGATVAFTTTEGNEAQGSYELSASNGKSRSFVFDSVAVRLAKTLEGFNSQLCSLGGSFDLGTIAFPQIREGDTIKAAFAWCQAVTKAAGDKPPIYKDPKLGLSNTKKTTSGVIIPAAEFPACGCSSPSASSR
ncbi:MAG: hypothetical protein R6X02_21660 [Enhygromyxa sp.]